MAAPISITGLCRSLWHASCIFGKSWKASQSTIDACRYLSTKNQHQVAALLSTDTGSRKNVLHCTSRFSSERQFCSKAAVEELDEPDVLYSKIVVEVKGHEPAVLRSYAYFVMQASQHLPVNQPIITTPKFHVYRHSQRASVHIYKKHHVQYEQRTHFKIIEFKHLTGSTADTLLEYIQRNLPEGTAMKVTRHRLATLPEHLKPPQKEIQKHPVS